MGQGRGRGFWLRVCVLPMVLWGCTADVAVPGGGAPPDGVPPPDTCSPRSCASTGAQCGELSDGCGGVLRCGTCRAGETCGGGGTANRCAPAPCTPKTCAQAGATCGSLADGCGGTLSCGTCEAGLTCGGSAGPNVCVRPPAKVPEAPKDVRATAGNATATVKWSAPARDGGSPVLRYTVTAQPGGAQAQTAAGTTEATFSRLSNGTRYTFHVTATNAVGTGPAAASNVVEPRAPCVRSLAPARSYRTGAYPERLAAADLDGDGRSDLIVGNTQDSSIGVLMNRGDGTFAPQVAYPVTSSSRFAVADFDGDSTQDIATSWQLNLLFNPGDGRLETLVQPGYVLTEMAAADLDEDGLPDLVLESKTGQGIEVALNQGAGNFSPSPYTGAERWVNAITAADLNGDGHVDVAFKNWPEPLVRVRLGKGDGTLGPEVPFAAEATAYRILATDLDADGRPDLVLNGYEGRIVVLLSRGDGTFRPPVTYLAPGWTSDLASGDFDGNGTTDVVVLHGYQDSVQVLANKGDGTLTQGPTYAVGDQPGSVVAADFDGNGLPDLAVTSFVDGTVSVLLNRCPR